MRKHAKHAHVNSFLMAQKRFLYALYYYIPNIKLKKCYVSHLCVKYNLKMYWEVWKFESGKVWTFEMENV